MRVQRVQQLPQRNIDMISLILAKKILSLFLVMALGIVLVRCGVVRSQDSKVLCIWSCHV